MYIKYVLLYMQQIVSLNSLFSCLYATNIIFVSLHKAPRRNRLLWTQIKMQHEVSKFNKKVVCIMETAQDAPYCSGNGWKEG